MFVPKARSVLGFKAQTCNQELLCTGVGIFCLGIAVCTTITILNNKIKALGIVKFFFILLNLEGKGKL